MPRRSEIRKELRELRADPGQPGARGRLQRLLGELRRLDQADDVDDMAAVAPATWRSPEPLSAEAAAITTWPKELRERMRRGSYSAKIYDFEPPATPKY